MATRTTRTRSSKRARGHAAKPRRPPPNGDPVAARAHGQTGLSIAFDNPTIMGYDSDHPKAHGEIGRCGVAVDSLRDMEILLDGIDPGAISTSMTINGPASIMFGFYLANAEKRGVPFERLRGTLQNDILKEYIAQKC